MSTSKQYTRREMLTKLAVAASGATLGLFGIPHLKEPLMGIATAKERTPHAKYFVQAAKDDPELAPLLENNGKGLRAHIVDVLGKVTHATPGGYTKAYAKKVFWEKPTAKQLSQLTTTQLIKIHYVLKALSDPVFQARVGNELEKDTADTTCEHGGMLWLRAGKVVMEMIPNEEIEPGEMMIGSHDPDRGYNPKWVPQASNALGIFHFHAREFGLEHCALSGGDFFGAPPFGFTEFFLFSRPNPKHFNVDIGLVLGKKDGQEVIDIDLGVYEQ